MTNITATHSRKVSMSGSIQFKNRTYKLPCANPFMNVFGEQVLVGETDKDSEIIVAVGSELFTITSGGAPCK